MNNEWAVEQLRHFIESVRWARTSAYGQSHAAPEDQIVAQTQVIEQIFARVVPDWQERVQGYQKDFDHWAKHRAAAQRALAQLERQYELSENLGESAPNLNAAQMHRWVWDGARSLWESGHFREAVAAAAVKVNAETQNKTGRHEISGTKLFQEAFSLKAPEANKPKLRLTSDDGSDTYKSLQEGAIAFATGCYRAIRNPTAHVAGKLSEPEALEQLAAFSVLARWVDAAELVEQM